MKDSELRTIDKNFNRFRFRVGHIVEFTDEAIKEKIYEPHYLKDIKPFGGIFVTDTKDVPNVSGSTGQWIKTRFTPDEWIDAYWFERTLVHHLPDSSELLIGDVIHLE